MKPHPLWLFTFALAATLAAPTSVQAYYNPSTGRWLSRDPIAEHAKFSTALRDPLGQPSPASYVRASHSVDGWKEKRIRTESTNEYAFLANDPIVRFDYLGLMSGGCTRRPCCAVWWDADIATPIGSKKCVYAAVIFKVDPVSTPRYPQGCCPKIGKGTPYGKYTVFSVFIREPCIADDALPAVVRVKMFDENDPPYGAKFYR